MTTKTFKVYFANTQVGNKKQTSITKCLTQAHEQHGKHLPAMDLSNERFQVRDLQKVQRVWMGTFAKLRDELPHVVRASNNAEREIDVEDDEHVVEKCHFVYRERANVVVWQLNKNAGGLTRFANYLSRVFDNVVTVNQVMNEAQLDRILSREIHEISFKYAKPKSRPTDSPPWTQHEFDKMNSIGASEAVMQLRAPRRRSLGANAGAWVRAALGVDAIERVKVKLTDESDPIELFTAPLKSHITVKMKGRYPVVQSVYEGLESSYDEHKDNIPPFTPEKEE